MRTVPALRLTADQRQAEQLAAAQAVEHGQSERCRPAMICDGVEEALQVGVVPRLDLSLTIGLDHLARHPDPSCRAATQLAGLHRVGQRGAQHHPEDLNAAPRHLPAGSQPIEPTSDIVAVETVDTYRAESGLDVRRRPLVLQPGLR